MKCFECRWHHNLNATNDRTEWKNCMALPYPQCVESFTHVNAECPIPHLFQPAVQQGDKNVKASLVVIDGDR